MCRVKHSTGSFNRKPLDAGKCCVWRITAVACVVVGPARFNRGLAEHDSKAAVHFSAFDVLLQQIWERAADGRRTFVCGDKHGGRHYYLPPLSQAFPEAWIDRGPEGPDLSRYTIRDRNRRLELSLALGLTRQTAWSRWRRLSARP